MTLELKPKVFAFTTVVFLKVAPKFIQNFCPTQLFEKKFNSPADYTLANTQTLTKCAFKMRNFTSNIYVSNLYS